MTNRGDIFAELSEGFDALKSEREGKRTLRIFKVDSKSSPLLSPQEVIQVGEQLKTGNKTGQSATHRPRC